MALDRALRRTILVAALVIVLLAAAAALLQDWWTVEASGGGLSYRVFEAGPFRSEAGNFLDPFDGAIDGAVRTVGLLVVAGLLGALVAGVALLLPATLLPLPSWTSRAAAGVACLCLFAAALVAPSTWPEEWRDYTNDRTRDADVRIERAEWNGRWTPDEDVSIVYESKPGWWFAWGAAGMALLAAAFDYASAQAWFPTAAPPPVAAAPPRTPAAPPPPPPPPRAPDFTRRY